MNRVLYEASGFPILQNRVYSSREDAVSCLRGDIRIIEDEKTGLVYNDAFRPQLMHYDSNYNNEQGNSPFFQKHLQIVKEIIRCELGDESLVEVGCGKGFFLELLLADGFDITGFDPTYEGNNPRIEKTYFNPSVTQPCRALILRHVLEHVPDPYRFLSELRDANGGQGLIYIEVPCFDWICERRAWFDIFYEHVNYFRMIDFFKMFGSIRSSGKLFGDQYIYVVADLSKLNAPKYTKENAVYFPENFLISLTSEGQNKTKQNVVVWGGASKGVIFSLLRERSGIPVTAVVDINSEKQEKFLPVTGLRVLSPESFAREYSRGSIVYIMNSNYVDEIKDMSSHAHHYVVVA